MFFENEFTGTFTFLQLLLALLIGIAPIALAIPIKITFHRRRLAEDKTLWDHDAIALASQSGQCKSRRALPAHHHRRMRLERRFPKHSTLIDRLLYSSPTPSPEKRHGFRRQLITRPKHRELHHEKTNYHHHRS